MILEEETFEKFGYYPSDWALGSHKRILVVCDKCGKIREIRKAAYTNFCLSCAKKKETHYIKRVRTIFKYLCFNNPYGIAWHQKIDEDGKLQGIGYFRIEKPGKATIEKRRQYNRNWSPIMKAKRKKLGFHKISFEHLKCVWHHVNQNDVVSTPIKIHQSFHHTWGNNNIEGVIG